MCEFAPIIMVRTGAGTRIVERLLPATSAEKYVYYMFFFLVAVPLSCYTLPWVASALFPYIYGSDRILDSILRVRDSMPPMLVFSNVLGAAGASLTCFYVVMRARSNRIAKGIASVFLLQIAIGLLGGIYGFALAFKTGFKDGMSSAPIRSEEELVSSIMSGFTAGNYIVHFLLAMLAIYAVVMLVLSYRVIHKQNI